MAVKYLMAMGIVFLVMLTWVLVQHLARVVAARHPEWGPAREEGGGCGKSCGCSLGEQRACRQAQTESDPKNAAGREGRQSMSKSEELG